jgi:hypothetical protein
MDRSNKRVIEWRRRMKVKAVAYLGGKCIKCGYDKCIRALGFHHRDPEMKLFRIGSGCPKRWELIKAELDKCDLLCANCHMEEEDKIYWGVAQSVQQATVTRPYDGSNPSAPANGDVA